MSRLRIKTIRGRKPEEYKNLLEECKSELSSLRVSKVIGSNITKLAKIRIVRKNIARVLTAFNQAQKTELRKLYNGQKHKPLDLRHKKTRALRRALTKRELAQKTQKQLHKLRAFPLRKFAVKA